MKLRPSKLHFLFLGLWLGCAAHAQYKWTDPLQQTPTVVRGQAWPDELKGTYARLPLRAEGKVRKPLWDLSRNSAGLSVAFRSNAPEIKVRYVVKGNLAMQHMPATGVSGMDLYATDANGQSRWCRGGYAFGDTVTYTYSGLTYFTDPAKGYEYELFMPLYNTVEWMEIGVPAEAMFRFLPVSGEKPIVIYGTSIAQGACTSRPGMAWANIVNRKSQHPVINLGFSGNGKLEPELFDLLSEINAGMYIIDCMPNLPGKNAEVIYERTLQGVKKLRAASQAPILLVEHSGYTNEFSNQEASESYKVANAELLRAYQALLKESVPQLYYLTKEEIGLTMDAMVEGVHPSDLGMQQYADSYLKKIREILNEETGSEVSSCTPCKQQRDPYDWNGRHEEILKLNKESVADILLFGNSITHFWGGEPVYEKQYGKNAWNKLFKGKKVRNLGFGWDRTENVLWRIHHDELDNCQAKTIFVLIGTNNLQVNTDEEVVEGILQVAKAIRQRQPQARLCVLGILPRTGMEPRIRQVNGLLQQRLAQEQGNSLYIDLAPQLTDDAGNIIPSLFMDGLHPNEKGYERMAEGLRSYL